MSFRLALRPILNCRKPTRPTSRRACNTCTPTDNPCMPVVARVLNVRTGGSEISAASDSRR
jgi:hypothetical protein